MKNINVLDYMESLEKEDKHLGLFVKMYEALSSFLTDFDFLKDSKGLTQKDVADKMETTQSAISRIASMKTNPSYNKVVHFFQQKKLDSQLKFFLGCSFELNMTKIYI